METLPSTHFKQGYTPPPWNPKIFKNIIHRASLDLPEAAKTAKVVDVVPKASKIARKEGSQNEAK